MEKPLVSKSLAACSASLSGGKSLVSYVFNTDVESDNSLEPSSLSTSHCSDECAGDSVFINVSVPVKNDRRFDELSSNVDVVNNDVGGDCSTKAADSIVFIGDGLVSDVNVDDAVDVVAVNVKSADVGVCDGDDANNNVVAVVDDEEDNNVVADVSVAVDVTGMFCKLSLIFVDLLYRSVGRCVLFDNVLVVNCCCNIVLAHIVNSARITSIHKKSTKEK